MTVTYSRLPLVDPASATGEAQKLLTSIERQTGQVPNILRGLASSSAALDGYLAFSGRLRRGTLDPKIAERVALALAEVNRCQYCLSAHSALAQQAGLGSDEIDAARRGGSADVKAAAAVRFATSVVEHRGDVTAGEIDGLREVGFTDGEIVEIVAHVALNIFTNYFGKVAQLDIDFPEVALLDPRA